VNVPAAAGVLLPPGGLLGWPSDPQDVERVRAVPAGATVALADRRPGGRRRLRRAAERLGVHVDAEYLVLPTWRLAAFVVSDDPDALKWLVETFLSTPPRIARGHALAEGATTLARRVVQSRIGVEAVRRLLGAVAPGRLVIGTRT
jgi:hypothetical protein